MSRPVLVALIAAVAALSCTASTSDPMPGGAADYDPTLADLGSEVYLRSCASCHGLDGTGGGPVVPSLRVAPPDLTLIAARRGGHFPAGEVARLVDGRFEMPAHGTREMPVWGERFGEQIPEASLSEEIARGQIASLIEYLKSIQRSE